MIGTSVATLRRESFYQLSHTSDLMIGTSVATLRCVWCDRGSAGTGRPGVNILWLGLIHNFYLNVGSRSVRDVEQPSNIEQRSRGIASTRQTGRTAGIGLQRLPLPAPMRLRWCCCQDFSIVYYVYTRQYSCVSVALMSAKCNMFTRVNTSVSASLSGQQKVCLYPRQCGCTGVAVRTAKYYMFYSTFNTGAIAWLSGRQSILCLHASVLVCQDCSQARQSVHLPASILVCWRCCHDGKVYIYARQYWCVGVAVMKAKWMFTLVNIGVLVML